MSVQILPGDCRETLRTLAPESVQCCVTSPPYWGLRDYGHAGQLGLEATPELYVAAMVEVFREVRRVLADDGTLWLNIGDSYAGSGKGPSNSISRPSQCMSNVEAAPCAWIRVPDGLKQKDLVGIPWMVAFALRADGWWLRGDNIWGKPNGMPESTKDRPCRAHEYVFLLSKSADYFYDYEAVRLPPLPSTTARLEQHIEAQRGSIRANGGEKTNGTMKAVRGSDKQRGHTRRHAGFNDRWDAMERSEQQENGAALRSVWWIAPAQTRDGHYAVMPENLAALCILAGSRAGDTVLDPFGGSGTTAVVAEELGRRAILCELAPHYLPLIQRRLAASTPGLALT